MQSIIVGENIPLSLQVYDANESLEVLAVLTDNYGIQHRTVKLTHIVNGLYTSLTEQMPDVPYIFAQYITNKPDDYELSFDSFKSIPKSIAKEKYLVGEVVSIEKSKEIIVGEIVDEKEISNIESV